MSGLLSDILPAFLWNWRVSQESPYRVSPRLAFKLSPITFQRERERGEGEGKPSSPLVFARRQRDRANDFETPLVRPDRRRTCLRRNRPTATLIVPATDQIFYFNWYRRISRFATCPLNGDFYTSSDRVFFVRNWLERSLFYFSNWILFLYAFGCYLSLFDGLVIFLMRSIFYTFHYST